MSILKVRKPILSFHGDEAIKRTYLDRVIAHRKADEIIKGYYWDKGKGGAVGCTLHSSNHRAYETELGIPAQFAYIENGIFERLSNSQSKLFPELFLQAIPVGVDLYPAFWRFMLFVLVDETNGLVVTVTQHNQLQDGIHQVADFYQQALDGKEIDVDKYLAALDVLDVLAARNARNALLAWNALLARNALDALGARLTLAPLAALDVLDTRPALDARVLMWRDKLLECLAAS